MVRVVLSTEICNVVT